MLFAAASLLPFFGSGYWLSLGVSIAMYTVLATSWALFSGPTNYISLATAAFFGVGMYTVAAGLNYLPFPVLIVVAGIAGALFALIVGLATLRISGVYFVIFTLGLAELVRQIVAWPRTSRQQRALCADHDVGPTLYWLLAGPQSS